MNAASKWRPFKLDAPGDTILVRYTDGSYGVLYRSLDSLTSSWCDEGCSQMETGDIEWCAEIYPPKETP